MQSPPIDLSKAESVEFKVRSEPWLKYRLDDENLLFTRLVVLKIYKTDQYDAVGQPVYIWTSQNLFTTVAKKKGSPSPTPLTSSDPRDYNTLPADFTRVGAEEWNVYETLDGSVISVKLEVTNVMKTDKFGPDGEPFYMINAQTVAKVKVNPNLIKKQTVLPKVSSERKPQYG